MTEQDFMPGWLLLVNQPWGRQYNRTTRAGEPTPDATLQFKFYYRKLRHGSAEAWAKTAELYAAGREWPSVSDLQTTMNTHERKPRQLTDTREARLYPMPPAIKAMVHKFFGEPRRTFGCWIDESVAEERTDELQKQTP